MLQSAELDPTLGSAVRRTGRGREVCHVGFIVTEGRHGHALDDPDGSDPSATHRAILELQRSVGNQAVAALLGEGALCRARSPKMSRPDPLVDHPYLKRALSPDQYAALTTPGGRLSVPLVQFLPPNLAYQSREQIIATLYPQLATEAGPAPNVKELIDQITDSETLRTFLAPKLRGPVSITVDVDDTVSFFFEGAAIKSEDGMIEPPALDQVSIATIDVIVHEAHQEPVQLADLRFLDAMATYASEHITPLAIPVVTDPGELRGRIGAANGARDRSAGHARRTDRDRSAAWQPGPRLARWREIWLPSGAHTHSRRRPPRPPRRSRRATRSATPLARRYEDPEDELGCRRALDSRRGAERHGLGGGEGRAPHRQLRDARPHGPAGRQRVCLSGGPDLIQRVRRRTKAGTSPSRSW